MSSLVNSVRIGVPVEVAFRCVKNPANFNDLMPDVEFTDVVLTEEGIGTTYQFHTKVAGIQIAGSGTFTEYEENRHIHDETSIATEGSLDWRFEPEAEGALVTLEHLPGRYWGVPILGRLLAGIYERSDRQTLSRLKDKLEAA